MHTDLAIERRKIAIKEGGIISINFVAPSRALDLDNICDSLVESLREEEGKSVDQRDIADLEDNIGMCIILWHMVIHSHLLA